MSESDSDEDDVFAEDQGVDDEIEEQYAEYVESVPPVEIPQSTIYSMIISAVHSKDSILKVPNNNCQKVFYVLFFPINFLQAYSIPNPSKEGKENYYPLSLFMAVLWIYFMTYFIVWWTYVLTVTYELHFSILPMVLYPFGIALRDQKKF